MLWYNISDTTMLVVSVSVARENFRAVLDRVETDAAMALDIYNSLMETVRLLRSPANAAHPQRFLEQAERGGWPGRRPINPLIQACLRDPLDGIGKPEPQRETLAGVWSRRIDTDHRLMDRLDGDLLLVLAC